MKTGMSQALKDHYRREVTTTAACWRIHLKDGTKILGTDCDRDIEVTNTNCHRVVGTIFSDLTGIYRAGAGIRVSNVKSSADMSVDNAEADGVTSNDLGIPDLTVARIESGIADFAPVFAFTVNWQDPDAGQNPVNCGFLGKFERDSTGFYRTEVRSLEQLLQQNILQTYAERCQIIEFGGTQCGFDLAANMRLASITAVTSRRAFRVHITSGAAPPTATYFDRSKIEFTSGDNAGFFREARSVTANGSDFDVVLFEEFPEDPQIGDALKLPPGCDRTAEVCKLHGRFVHGFTGYGVFMPGALALMRGAL